MKPVMTALILLALALPATSQGNTAPDTQVLPPSASLSPLAQQAFNACPGLMSRTESAVASGHTQHYYASDCECMAQAIDYNTWNESTAAYDGPKMPDSDAYVIIGAFSSSATIEAAFAAVDSNVSETGYSAVSACYGK